MQIHQPVVVALALDDSTADVVEAARRVARAVGAQIVPVHALPRLPLSAERRHPERTAEVLRQWLASAASEGAEIAEPIVEVAEPAELALRTAARTGAQMIVVGGGSGPTIQEWLVGSVPSRIVRSSRVPVFIARGTLPGHDRPVLVPVDAALSSHLALAAGLRFARAFQAPLRVLSVAAPPPAGTIEGADLERIAGELDRLARTATDELLAAHDTGGVKLDVSATTGAPAAAIVEAARDCSLVVVAASAFGGLAPMGVPETAERVVRFTRSSVLAVRDTDPKPEERDTVLHHVAELVAAADKHRKAGEAEAAVRLLGWAAGLAPGNASLQERMADALDDAGRANEAAEHRKLAATLRAI